MEFFKRFYDNCRVPDIINLSPERIASKIEFFDDFTGKRIWEPLHNKTVIAGSALTAMKVFNLSNGCLDNTPTYNDELELNFRSSQSIVPDNECNRYIMGFCVGQGGAGLDISDVFNVDYCSWITPDNLIPFMYPLATEDNVDTNYYKGKKSGITINSNTRNAYYFKVFSNEPTLTQIDSDGHNITDTTVYSGIHSSARSYVELHLKITKADCREFFIASTGIAQAKINQISLVSAWQDVNGEFRDIRPFSLLNIPTEILSDLEKSITAIYTLYF